MVFLFPALMWHRSLLVLRKKPNLRALLLASVPVTRHDATMAGGSSELCWTGRSGQEVTLGGAATGRLTGTPVGLEGKQQQHSLCPKASPVQLLRDSGNLFKCKLQLLTFIPIHPSISPSIPLSIPLPSLPTTRTIHSKNYL